MAVESKAMDHIRKVLEQFGDKYFTKNGVLKRNAVIEDLDNYDKDIMTAILKDDLLHETYTSKIADVEIFEINKFVDMLRYKEYWEDSFTKYNNKIGLTVGGRYIDDSSDVVLDFPYKDCVLKAGMTKEDVEHSGDADEPFLNETLAKPEIDELLEPKIFVNTTKYDQNGRVSASSISNDDNLVIKGNNLIALHSLKLRYKNKIKMIYIDVPYYFKKRTSEDSFKYNSNFPLSTWLTFMKSRLEIAKDLLKPHGSIWINISDDGMHYLKVLADSVFNADKFLGTIPRKTRNGKSDVPFNLSQDFDWLLVYTNGSEKSNVVGRTVERKYFITDDFPGRPWRTADLTKQTTTKERPNSDFTMVNPRTGKEYPVNPKRSWAVTKDTFDEWYKNGGIGFPDDYEFMSGEKPFRRVFKDEDEKKKKSYVSTDFLVKLVDKSTKGEFINKYGNDQITELFNRDSFDYAKPEQLLKSIIEVTTNKNDIVLDFFMGSATTQAVAMKMHRRFIGIEQMDYIHTVSVPRLQKVIDGEQGGISKDVNWQGGGTFIYAELMEKNQGYLKDIQNAKDMDELMSIYSRMKQNSDIDFRVDLDKFEASLKDGELPSLSDRKKELIRIIDKNQLYYNYSDIDDANVRDLISDSDYKFNKSFYSSNEAGEE